MSKADHRTAGGFPLVAWLLVGAWACVIWGHSLMSGTDSGNESQWVIGLLIRAVNHVGLGSHPLVLRLSADPALLSFVVRKVAHFSEYFVLGLLVFSAVRKTFASLVGIACALLALWVFVPGVDETIQRFVPGRAGMVRDVLIDMGGFGAAVVIAGAISLVAMALGRRE